jgi:uncharacterized protein
MRWQGRRGSANVEDRRGQRIPMRPVGVGCGGVVLVLLISWLTGANPMQLLQLLSSAEVAGPEVGSDLPAPAPSDELGTFAAVVLASTEDTWNTLLPRLGAQYQEPVLVLYRDAWPSACGLGQSAMGPFYCPADGKVYLDLSFFDEMSQRLGAPGDFAQAYVIAHEVGHHVQNVLGISSQMRELQQRARSQAEANDLSVRLELQADCLAGVWGHFAARDGLIEPGDFEEGLRAAAAIGDDRLQRQTRGYVSPDSFTHGSSEQRMRWLHAGLESGDPNACDTFGASRL